MFSPYDYYITPEEYEEAARNGIKPNTLEKRIRYHGWEKQRAITAPLQMRTDRSAIMAIANMYGITYNQFMNRIYIGWDEQTAATTPLRDNTWRQEQARQMAEKRLKYPREMIEFALSNGVSYANFKNRVQRCGWDQMRAATTPVSPLNRMKRMREIMDWVFVPVKIKKGNPSSK